MPLTKAQKALYEAALRRKGLQPGKAVRQDPRTFVGPIRMEEGRRPDPYHAVLERVLVPSETYWNHRGRLQDLEDELLSANNAGLWERRNPLGNQYHRYYNNGDIPRGFQRGGPVVHYGSGEGLFYRPVWQERPVSMGPKTLTRMGELELEARADEMIENDYKDYLKKMYQRFPNRAAVREQFPEEYNAMPYLEELWPEE